MEIGGAFVKKYMYDGRNNYTIIDSPTVHLFVQITVQCRCSWVDAIDGKAIRICFMVAVKPLSS